MARYISGFPFALAQIIAEYAGGRHWPLLEYMHGMRMPHYGDHLTWLIHAGYWIDLPGNPDVAWYLTKGTRTIFGNEEKRAIILDAKQVAHHHDELKTIYRAGLFWPNVEPIYEFILLASVWPTPDGATYTVRSAIPRPWDDGDRPTWRTFASAFFTVLICGAIALSATI